MRFRGGGPAFQHANIDPEELFRAMFGQMAGGMGGGSGNVRFQTFTMGPGGMGGMGGAGGMNSIFRMMQAAQQQRRRQAQQQRWSNDLDRPNADFQRGGFGGDAQVHTLDCSGCGRILFWVAVCWTINRLLFYS